MDLTFLGNYSPYILIFGGIIVASWLLEKKAKPTSIVKEPTNWFTRTASFFGFFVGILLIITAAVVWSTKVLEVDNGTRYLMIVTGITLVLKPLRNVPWAALLGMIVGSLCIGFVFLYYPLPGTVYGISSTWIYLLIFFLPAVLVYWFFKFLEDIFKLVAMILTFKPVTILLGALCITQGILMLLGLSLFTIL